MCINPFGNVGVIGRQAGMDLLVVAVESLVRKSGYADIPRSKADVPTRLISQWLVSAF